MDVHAGFMEIAILVVAVGVAGIVSGVLAGLFGIGGGAIIVPVLYQALAFVGVDDAVRMHVSVGSSLAIIVPTAIRSFQAHRARGAVDMALLRAWLVVVPVGVIAATAVVAYIPGAGLRALFAVMAFVLSIRLLFNRESWRLGDDLPKNPALSIAGLLIGFLSTLVGVGGGVLNNAFMTLYNRPIHQAVATSSGLGVLISIPAIFGYMWAGWGEPLLPPLSVGFISIPALLVVAPTAVLTAPLGVRLAHGMGKRQLEFAFGLFLIFIAARFAYSLLP